LLDWRRGPGHWRRTFRTVTLRPPSNEEDVVRAVRDPCVRGGRVARHLREPEHAAVGPGPRAAVRRAEDRVRPRLGRKSLDGPARFPLNLHHPGSAARAGREAGTAPE